MLRVMTVMVVVVIRSNPGKRLRRFVRAMRISPKALPIAQFAETAHAPVAPVARPAGRD
jgi:hypothetical protein